MREDSGVMSVLNQDPSMYKNPNQLMPESRQTKKLNQNERYYDSESSDSRELHRMKNKVTVKMEKLVDEGPKVPLKAIRDKFYTKFLEKSDVIEIAIELLEHDDVFELIHILYDDLTEPIPSNYRLFKLLVKTEHMSLFDLCLKKCLNPKKYATDVFDKIKRNVSMSRSNIHEKFNKAANLDEEEEHQIKSKGNRYDVQEIVSDSFSNAIIMNKMHIAFYLYREYRNAVLGNIQISIDSIIYAFKIDYQSHNKIKNVEERLFILEKFLPFIDYKKSFELIETFKSLLFEEANYNFLTYCLNPLKIIVMLMSLIKQLKVMYPLLKFQIDHLQEGLENVGSLLIRNSKSVEDVQDLLLDKLYNGIEIIDMVAYLNCIPILQNPVVDVIVSNMYYGPYQRGSFLRESMCVQVIQNEMSFFPGKDDTAASKMTIFAFKQGKRTNKNKSKNVYEIEDDGSDSDDSSQKLEIKANEAKDNRTKTIMGHMFQFAVWKKSLDVKYIFNAVIAFFLAVAMQIYSVLLIQQVKDADSIDAQITTTTADTTLGTKERNQLLDQYTDDLDASTAIYYEYITLLLVIHILTIAYLFQDFQEIIYSRLRGVYTKVITLSLILNIITTVIVLYWLYKYLYEYTVNLDGIDSQRKVKTIIDRIEGDSYFHLELSVAFLTSIQYARMIFALQMSRVFGPMVKILGNMLVDLVIFIFMYLLVFLIFTCASQLLFHTIDGYGTFIDCSLTMFSASLGDFDFGVFANEGSFTKNVGYIFLVIYLTVSTITLLNFLIAILSNTYDFLQSHKNALYLREVILLRQKYCFNQKYSSIVSAFVPLNIFALLMDPFIICLKSKKLNYLCLVFEYVILGLLSIALFFAISVILIPISYVILVMNKLKYCFQKPFFGKQDFVMRVLDLIAITIVGFFWLALLLVWNTLVYAWNLLSEDIKLVEENDEEKLAHVNALKDGSIDYSKFNQMYGEPMGGLDTKNSKEQRNPVYKNDTSGNVGNPIKEGISLTTLKLLKMTLIIMKEDYLFLAKKEQTSVIMVPVEVVIKEMYKNLCIQEHINQVCLGIHYEKDLSFFESSRFDRIIQGFSLYEERESKVPKQNLNFKNLAKGIFMKTILKKRNDIRGLFWRNKLKNFIIKSDEKWILDQYNLIKRFCLDNSVEAVPT